LQEKILQAGGIRLRSQKAAVDGLVEQIEACNDSITKLQVERNIREKNILKVEKLVAKKEAELDEVNQELEKIAEQLSSKHQESRKAEDRLSQISQVFII
jgi:structural maintenance of chromosome 4